jgi:hypothetical protein
VTRESDAFDRPQGVFKLGSPKEIASSLKRPAERSLRRKTDHYHSALSMFVFYISRAGKKFTAVRKRALDRAKAELKRLLRSDQYFAVS